MKENFVIREERHPGARSIAKIAETGAWVCLGLSFLFLLLSGSADDYDTWFLYNGLIGIAWFCPSQ